MRTIIALALLLAAAASPWNAAAAWEDYDTDQFPNGSQIWSLDACARAYRDTPYLGCYASPELTITRKEHDKPAVKLKGIIVSKILPNENNHDSGGYGYCLGDKHPYRIVHEVRVMEKGRAVAYLYPEFYGSAFKPGTAQSLYEWGGGLWGTANCDKTDKTLVFTGNESYAVASPAAALDFGNIVFSLEEKQLTFTKLRPTGLPPAKDRGGPRPARVSGTANGYPLRLELDSAAHTLTGEANGQPVNLDLADGGIFGASNGARADLRAEERGSKVTVHGLANRRQLRYSLDIGRGRLEGYAGATPFEICFEPGAVPAVLGGSIGAAPVDLVYDAAAGSLTGKMNYQPVQLRLAGWELTDFLRYFFVFMRPSQM